MLKPLINKSIVLSMGLAMGFALLRPALAEPLPCPVNRDAAGNCGVSRIGPDLKIEQLGYNVSKAYKQATVRGRGLSDMVGGLGNVDARWAVVTIIPGGFSRWHYHPGANFLSVEKGTGVYYTVEANGTCKVHDLSTNPEEGVTGTIEIPGQVHTLMNTGSEDLVIRVLFTKAEYHQDTGEGDPNFTENADQPQDPSCPTGFNP